MKNFVLLETIYFDSLEEQHRLAFGDNKPVINEMRNKYPDKKLSFQTVMTAVDENGKTNYLLNVFESFI